MGPRYYDGKLGEEFGSSEGVSPDIRQGSEIPGPREPGNVPEVVPVGVKLVLFPLQSPVRRKEPPDGPGEPTNLKRCDVDTRHRHLRKARTGHGNDSQSWCSTDVDKTEDVYY